MVVSSKNAAYKNLLKKVVKFIKKQSTLKSLISWNKQNHYSNSEVILKYLTFCRYGYKNIKLILQLSSFCLSTPFQLTVFKLENVLISKLIIVSPTRRRRDIIETVVSVGPGLERFNVVSNDHGRTQKCKIPCICRFSQSSFWIRSKKIFHRPWRTLHNPRFWRLLL